jgi:serine/threonine protein kinase
MLFIVMELVAGGDLFDRVNLRQRYSDENARVVMSNILSAVSYLHANGIVHRDLKPENILLVSADSDTDVKITDFGLAKKANQEGLKTFCGTPQYFAPEVLKRRNTFFGAGEGLLGLTLR